MGIKFISLKKLVSLQTKKLETFFLLENRKGNVYIADFNSSKAESLTCLLSKASVDDSWIWHKKLPHLNFKAMNLLVQKDLVRGLPNKGIHQRWAL